MLAALCNVRPSHLFDAGLWQKLGLHLEPERGDALGEGLDTPQAPDTAQPVEQAALQLPAHRGRSLRVL
jgi:hypothetical protein